MPTARYMTKIKIILILAIIAVGSVSVRGQTITPIEELPKEPPRRVDPFDSLYQSRHGGIQINQIEVIRKLVSQGAFISAVGMLEDLYSKEPDNREVVDLLFICYMELKAYSKAEMLVKRVLEKTPHDPGYNSRLLQLYMQAGNDSLVTEQAHAFIDRFSDNLSSYDQVIAILKANGYDDLGMEFIETARTKFNDPNLFLVMAGSFYEVRRDYGLAVKEYFKAAYLDSATAQEADAKMAALIRYPDSPDEIIDTLESLCTVNPGDTFALKFLSEAYIKNERYAEAFESTIRLDSLTGGDGREVFNYLRRCRDRGLYDEVVKVAEYLDRNKQNKTVPYNYKLFYAEALRGLNRPQDALAVYRAIEQEVPRPREKAEALMYMGNVYRYDLKNYDTARMYYDSTIKVYDQPGVRLGVSMEMAALYLMEGNLDLAREEYTRLQGEKLLQDSQERIAYNLAMIELFKKNYVEADMLFRKLIAEYPRGMYLNDALITSLNIRESAESYPAVLGNFADALYYDWRELPDSSEIRLLEVISQGGTPLLGNSIYRLAVNYASVGKTESALELINRVEAEYSEDYFYPYCLKLKGDIFTSDENRRKEGVEIYKTILERYGNYPFVGEVREKLQEYSGYLTAG